ncbi:hypothetical protein [Nostoc commune]|nr:hypothetical protein [Nostoc commune]
MARKCPLRSPTVGAKRDRNITTINGAARAQPTKQRFFEPLQSISSPE